MAKLDLCEYLETERTSVLGSFDGILDILRVWCYLAYPPGYARTSQGQVQTVSW